MCNVNVPWMAWVYFYFILSTFHPWCPRHDSRPTRNALRSQLEELEKVAEEALLARHGFWTFSTLDHGGLKDQIQNDVGTLLHWDLKLKAFNLDQQFFMASDGLGLRYFV